VSTTPGLVEILQRDWMKAARFYTRFGITEAQFQGGVPGNGSITDADLFPAFHFEMFDPSESNSTKAAKGY
jgi:hypothetical protein